MAFSQNAYERGSEWRQWDLHIHTPASFHWKGQRLTGDEASDRALIDQMISALNDAQPAVFALMDYWTFEGWFALQKRLKEPGAPTLTKTVFPGIELRLKAPTTCRVNAHVLFSDEIERQALLDFRSALTVEIINRPLSDAGLIELARAVGSDKLKHHGFKKDEVDADTGLALTAGASIAEINADSYRAAVEKVPKGHAIGFMPYDTSDGLSEVKWHDHYAFFLGLFASSPIFETRNATLRSAFIGEKTPENSNWFHNFQHGLKNIRRLAVAGSDAHRFTDYGKFPSAKATWIKADPTFLGLLQAIKEPVNRSFIGEKPPKLREVEENKTYFIETIQVQKAASSSLDADWLAGSGARLNSDLVAIIGNKGSGKSALADVIALLGNSKQVRHFSFLKKDRFRGKSGDPARQFAGEMRWADGSTETRNLADNPPPDKVQLVRYIPQGHFEELCNEHASGRSDAFERELRAVIFDHAGEAIRLGALDFDQLIEQQEREFRDRLGEYRKDLSKLNREIQNIEAQQQPEVRRSLGEMLTLKRKQIEEHNALKLVAMEKPSDDLSAEQQQAAGQLEGIAVQLKNLDDRSVQRSTDEALVAAKSKAVQAIRDRIRLLERQYKQLHQEAQKDLEILGLQLGEIVMLTVNGAPLDTLSDKIVAQQKELDTQAGADGKARTDLLAAQASNNAKLNEPQLRYQQNLAAISGWNEKLSALTGSAEIPETLLGIEARIAQLDGLPEQLKTKRDQRDSLCREIFDTLDAQRMAREALFKPVQDLIQANALIREEYKLQFLATLGGSPEMIASELFSLIKQNTGKFRGEDESFAVVRQLAETYNLGSLEDVLRFARTLDDEIHGAASGGNPEVVGISTLLRKDKTASEVYDLLFGLRYLEPRYSLLFQDTQIEQLSPGQRGALLLIFYLLVDKGRNPIVLDQPEENLDNETVVSLLVPVLTEAKKRRQVIMVTHNPNLAVVCDAEQIIYSSFDRKKKSRISYFGGSIENPVINKHVVDVLEGTKPAFNNRRMKYH
jgi:predicted ATPase